MILYLMRHGETLLNREGRLQGQIDTELDAEGIAEAERAGAFVKAQGLVFDRVYSSHLSRAVDTAALVSGWERDRIRIDDTAPRTASGSRTFLRPCGAFSWILSMPRSRRALRASPIWRSGPEGFFGTWQRRQQRGRGRERKRSASLPSPTASRSGRCCEDSTGSMRRKSGRSASTTAIFEGPSAGTASMPGQSPCTAGQNRRQWKERIIQFRNGSTEI